MNKKTTTVITGASSGLGKCLLKSFSASFNVINISRTKSVSEYNIISNLNNLSDLNEKLKMEFYTKYIAKMRYLETHYRTNNIYTEYHRQLENQPIHHTEAQPAEPIIATLVEPPLPSAPSDIYRSLNHNN